ncbi:MAG: cysteine desulfurase [Burkholderiales bacterium]|nr:cysteine desulfurase [Burkholderiales bacterium]
MAKSNRKLKNIYLDYAASVLPNPSSIHSLGVKAKKDLQKARKEVALVLGAHDDEVFFTSGGTESNNLAIQGAVYSFLEKNSNKIKPHIITTNIEHPSVLETFKILEKRKLAEITILPVEENGILDPKKIRKELKGNTVLVSVMYANNEIGTIQPIREIAKEIRHFNKNNRQGLLKDRPCLFHTDAVQAINYLDVNVERLGVDLLSISGTKIERAGRIGVLYKKRNVKLSPLFGGGDQEMGLRGGTENLPEILKLSKALKSTIEGSEKENKRLIKLRDYFIKKIIKFGCFLNGDLENRLPNNINVTFNKIPSDLLVLELSAKGVMTSSKSACKSSNKEGSYVIEALHSAEALLPQKEIGGLRFSLGKNTKKEDIDYTLKVLSQILLKLKKWYN